MTAVLPRPAQLDHPPEVEHTAVPIRAGSVGRVVSVLVAVLAVVPAVAGLAIASLTVVDPAGVGSAPEGWATAGWASVGWASVATVVAAPSTYLLARLFLRSTSPAPVRRCLMIGLIGFAAGLAFPAPVLGIGAGLILAGGLSILGGRVLLVVVLGCAPIGLALSRYADRLPIGGGWPADPVPAWIPLAVAIAGALLLIAVGLAPMRPHVTVAAGGDLRRAVPARLAGLVAGGSAYGMLALHPVPWGAWLGLVLGLAVCVPLLLPAVRRDRAIVGATLIGAAVGVVFAGLVDSRQPLRFGVPVLLLGILLALVTKERPLIFKRRSAPEVSLPAQQETEPVLNRPVPGESVATEPAHSDPDQEEPDHGEPDHEESRLEGPDPEESSYASSYRESAYEDAYDQEPQPGEPGDDAEAAFEERVAPPAGTPLAFEGIDDSVVDDGTIVSVRQTDATNVDGAVVTITDLSGRQVATGTTVTAGRHRIGIPEPGSYVLIVSAQGFSPYASVVELGPGRTDIEVELAGESGMVGTVRRAHGDPLEGATVTLTNPRGDVVVAQLTGVDGTYAFGELVPGSYTMTVTAHAYRPAALIVHIPETGTVRQDVELIGGASLEGTVRSQNGGRPMPEARVSLIDAGGRVVGVVPADAEGHYRFADIPEGEYTVVATAHPPAASGVRIVGGVDARHDLELAFPD